MKVLILGDGGHAKVVAQIMDAMDGLEPVGTLCKDTPSTGVTLFGLPVFSEADLFDIPHEAMVIALGDNRLRKKIFDKYSSLDVVMASVIHPSAIVAPDAIIEPGCMICAGAVVNPGSRIRVNTILNTGCTVDHDCDVGPHAHIAPGVNLAGDVNVNEGAFVGIGSCVIQGTTIGAWAVVGAGGAVIENVSPMATVVGVPARQK